MFVSARPNTLFNWNLDNAHKWKYWNRPKIGNRNGASEKTFSCKHLLRITSRTRVCVSSCCRATTLKKIHERLAVLSFIMTGNTILIMAYGGDGRGVPRKRRTLRRIKLHLFAASCQAGIHAALYGTTYTLLPWRNRRVGPQTTTSNTEPVCPDGLWERSDVNEGSMRLPCEQEGILPEREYSLFPLPIPNLPRYNE
ncbi:unnamed protein product [Nesidiocoris tenuis]|uniref:Uncharacterized protein n=1 Tax=Nesidiocoris tenuis TaxID=355587 RepID=A0A6H5H953_9HEMI|nr:unnamed protein product [Nesidiocoris tenuis]